MQDNNGHLSIDDILFPDAVSHDITEHPEPVQPPAVETDLIAKEMLLSIARMMANSKANQKQLFDVCVVSDFATYCNAKNQSSTNPHPYDLLELRRPISSYWSSIHCQSISHYSEPLFAELVASVPQFYLLDEVVGDSLFGKEKEAVIAQYLEIAHTPPAPAVPSDSPTDTCDTPLPDSLHAECDRIKLNAMNNIAKMLFDAKHSSHNHFDTCLLSELDSIVLNACQLHHRESPVNRYSPLRSFTSSIHCKKINHFSDEQYSDLITGILDSYDIYGDTGSILFGDKKNQVISDFIKHATQGFEPLPKPQSSLFNIMSFLRRSPRSRLAIAFAIAFVVIIVPML